MQISGGAFSSLANLELIPTLGADCTVRDCTAAGVEMKELQILQNVAAAIVIKVKYVVYGDM